MSKLHVTQIGGYLKKCLDGRVSMDDLSDSVGEEHKNKVFLTRSLGALAVSLLA